MHRKGRLKIPRLFWELGTIVLAFAVLILATEAIPYLSQGEMQMSTPTPIPGDTGPLRAIDPGAVLLSGEWRFAVDREAAGESQGWHSADFDDAAWETVTVPHTWNVMAAHYYYHGLAWYRRSFSIPAEAENAHLRLRFEAVFYKARVWVNGEYLGEHEGGYTPFEFDISAVVTPSTENVIAVQVDNERGFDRIPATLQPEWSYDWWNYGGIVRDVTVLLNSRAFISRQRIIAEPHLVAENQADSAHIRTTVTIVNTSSAGLEGTLAAAIYPDGEQDSVLAEPPSATVSVPPAESADIELATTIDSPALWHFDHPNLYRWVATLQTGDGQVLDVADVTFGVRSVEIREAQFILNGEPVRLVGLTRHADSPGHGLAEPVTVMAADYDDLKQLNMVFSRPVHYPQSEFILDYCDRHGILLIPELPAWQLAGPQMADSQMRALAQQQLREMVEADFNHPSVWAWSVGNEFESETRAGHEYVRDMIAYVKSLDPTRPVGFASNRLGNRPGQDATDLADFVMMNQYFGTWAGPKQNLERALDWIHETWPDRPVIISEFGFEPRWNRFWGPPTEVLSAEQFYFIPNDAPPDSDTADGQRRLVITEQMDVFSSKPFVVGAIFWTYQDYRTPSGFVMGVVDADRQRRGSWAVLREAFSPVLFAEVALAPVSEGHQRAAVTLRTRGPITEEIPAYTLRGYRLRWATVAPEGDTIYGTGELALPVLAPGTEWSGEVGWDVPETDYRIRLSIVRPTGFAVLDRFYDAQGQLLPNPQGRD